MSPLTSSLGAWTRLSTRAAGASRGRSRAAPTTRAKMAGDDDDANAGQKKTGAPAPGGVPVWQRKNVRMWEVDIEAEFERQERREREAKERQQKEAASGLGFGRLNDLNDMNVDLSAQLRAKKPDAAEKLTIPGLAPLPGGDAKERKALPGDASSSPTSAIDLATTNKQVSKYDLDGWNYAPTRAEQKRWQREWEKGEQMRAAKNPVYAKSKFSTRQMKKLQPKDLKPTVGGRELTEAEKAERRRTADDAYLKVKENLLLTTAGLCGSGTVGAFAVGGVPLGASFAMGSAGALFYVKLLASKAESGGGGQGGPPSILVPVILFMALNRWNFFFAEDVGVTLSPIPMLLGFFTYKPASIFQAFRDILEEEQNGDGDNEYA